MAGDDYSELPLYFEDMDDDYTVTVEVHLTDKTVITCARVNGNPVRYQGWWTIPHLRHNGYREQSASTLVAADRVSHWVTLTDAPEPASDQPPVEA